MSDMLDHELDAWESFDQYLDSDRGSYTWGGNGGIRDPNFYYSWKIVKIIRQADNAILVEKDVRFWVPRSLIRKIEKDRILVHSEIFNVLLRKTIATAKHNDLDDLPDLAAEDGKAERRQEKRTRRRKRLYEKLKLEFANENRI